MCSERRELHVRPAADAAAGHRRAKDAPNLEPAVRAATEANMSIFSQDRLPTPFSTPPPAACVACCAGKRTAAARARC